MALKRLLIVDDSTDFQVLMTHLFEAEGFQVNAVSNGQEALAWLNASPDLPDLILLDLMMPLMDGFEFRRQQKADPRLSGISVVIITAHGDIQDSLKKTGAKGVLRKTEDIDTIVETVKKNCA